MRERRPSDGRLQRQNGTSFTFELLLHSCLTCASLYKEYFGCGTPPLPGYPNSWTAAMGGHYGSLTDRCFAFTLPDMALITLLVGADSHGNSAPLYYGCFASRFVFFLCRPAVYLAPSRCNDSVLEVRVGDDGEWKRCYTGSYATAPVTSQYPPMTGMEVTIKCPEDFENFCGVETGGTLLEPVSSIPYPPPVAPAPQISPVTATPYPPLAPTAPGPPVALPYNASYCPSSYITTPKFYLSNYLVG